MDALSLLAQSKLVNPISGDIVPRSVQLTGTPSVNSFQFVDINITQSHYGIWTNWIGYKINNGNRQQTTGSPDQMLTINGEVLSNSVDFGKWSYIIFNGQSVPRSSNQKIEKSVFSKILRGYTFYVGDIYSTDHMEYERVYFKSYVGIEASNTGKARFYLRYSVTCPYVRCGSFSHTVRIDSENINNFTIPWPTAVDFQLEY